MNFEKEVKFLQLQVSDILRKIKAKSTSWGQLLGDIRNQKDLMRYFGLKQDLLKSGRNIKTINGQNILGSGDLQVTSSLGFTPENVANKATDFTIINHTLYPSVEAVKEQLDLKLDKDISTYPLATTPLTNTELILIYDGTEFKKVAISELNSGNPKKSIEYNVTTLCIFNFPATSNWTLQGGSYGMGAYGTARLDSGYSNFLNLMSSPLFAKVIGGIAPFDMKLNSNGSFVTPEPNLIGGDLKLSVGYIELNYSTGVISNATLVDAGTYTPVTSGRVDLREDFGGEITIPKGAIWCYSWAHTKTRAVSGVYIQTILNFEEV